MLRSTLLAAASAALFFVGGCQVNKPAVTANDAPHDAVMCAKCQTTWTKAPISQKGRVVAYSSKKSMTCPDCKSAAENFFKTGKLQHTCATCGPDAMEICKSH